MVAMLFITLAAASMVAALMALGHEGDQVPLRRMFIAWFAVLLMLHSLATFVLLWAAGDWDDPSSPRWLVSWGEPTVAVVTIVLTVGFALYLRRRVVLYVALAIVPLLVWYWSPAFE